METVLNPKRADGPRGGPARAPVSSRPATSQRIVDRPWFVLGAALCLQVLAWAILLLVFLAKPGLWYGFFDVSDVSVYQDYAGLFAQGLIPYRSVPFEYPPLAAVLMMLPSWLGPSGAYPALFVGEMIVLAIAAAGVTTRAAMRLWQRERAALWTAMAFAVAVLAAGPIVANRFDVAVALDMAALAYFLARRWLWPAAATLGIGFALKLTPAMFLPLVLLLSRSRADLVRCLAAFATAALVPFVPHLVRAGSGVLYVITYHLARPLQIESVLATPYLLLHAAGLVRVSVQTSFGSQGIVAPGTAAVAYASSVLMPFATLGIYALLWRRRMYLRRVPADVPFAALVVVLGFVCTSKVLSPQFLVWTFPFVALAVARRGRAGEVGILILSLLLVTQMAFPARYWDLVGLQTPPILLVALRNAGLVAAGIVGIQALRRLPST